MNTPKLTTLFPNPASSDLLLQGSRAASAPGKAFADVLGERAQSQRAANVTTRRESASKDATTNTAPSGSRVDASQRTPREDANTTTERTASQTSSAQSQQDRAAASSNSGTAEASPTPSEATPAGSSAEPSATAGDTGDTAAGSNTASDTEAAALAQHAADAGAVITAVAASNDAVLLPGQAVAANTIVAAVAPQHAGVQPITLSVESSLNTQAALLPASAAADGEATAAPLTLTNGLARAWQHASLQQQPLHNAAAQAAPATAAHAAPIEASPLLAAGEALFANTINALHANPSTAGQAGKPAVAADVLAGLATTAATSGTAAARSLQEFSAMMEAARATSSTIVPAQTPATPETAAGFAQHGLGLMPTGFSLSNSALAGGATGGQIAAPLNSPQWPTEMGRQFINIAKAATGTGQIAELRLDPPELGPLRITINLNDNVAQAVFSSPHALVRQTVENALPQLQQMLEEAGISLGQADVHDQDASGQSHQGESSNARASGTGSNATGDGTGGMDAGLAESSASRRSDPDALVDTFA